MPILILSVAVIFAIIALFLNLATGNGLNPFSNYFIFGANLIGHNFLLFLLGFGILTFLVTRIVKFEKSHPPHQKIITYLTQAFSIFLIGVFTSYVLLLLIAFLQLNIFSVMVNFNPHNLGIITDRNVIIKTLKASNKPPQIIASDNDQYKELQAIAKTTTGTNNFYGSSILPSIPGFLVLPIKSIGSSILLDQTLIISEINPEDLQEYSPLVGYLFVKSYFPTQAIKTFPKVYVMGEDEYQKYRQLDFNKKVADVQLQLNQTNQSIGTLSAAIQNDKDQIAYNKNFVTSGYLKRDKQYNSCMAQGSYKAGIFTHTNSKDYCQSQIMDLDNAIQQASNALDVLNKKLNDDQNNLDMSKLYASFFATQVKLGNLLKVNIPHELGAFDPPDTIKILINTTSSHAIADYFETVVHEYLHYASYNAKKSFTASFFEEGLTEYFARAAIQNNLNTGTNLGYPVYVKIISEMTKIIPETELADIYFSKDELRLRTTINRVYGDNFYTNNLIAFETLQYTSDLDQILKLANTIMAKINGTPLKESDIISTSSNL
jgi:hypothetical protein